MGFLGKLFGKKDDLDTSFDLGKPGSDPYASDQLADPMTTDSFTGKPMGADSFGHDPTGSQFGEPGPATGQYPQRPPMPGQQSPQWSPIQGQQSPQPMPGQQSLQQPTYEEEAPSRDVELILAKLDAIKAELDSVHQRVRRLESLAEPKQPGKKNYW